MKKIIVSIILFVLTAIGFSQPPAYSQQQSFPIHSEKRAFVKKADREKRRHHKHRHHKHHKDGKGHHMQKHIK
jgi:hypothetical protein